MRKNDNFTYFHLFILCMLLQLQHHHWPALYDPDAATAANAWHSVCLYPLWLLLAFCFKILGSLLAPQSCDIMISLAGMSEQEHLCETFTFYFIVTACQRSCWREMFSYVFVCPQWEKGSHMTITHNAFDLTLQRPPLSPASPPGPGPGPNPGPGPRPLTH